MLGNTITEIPGAIGYLIERVGEVNGFANRTSVLFYTPDAGAMSGDITVLCSGGGGPCSNVTRFIG